MTQKILVTGASGFVAKHLISQLLDKGYHVRGTLRDMDKSDAVRAAVTGLCGPEALGRLDLVKADLLEAAGWDEAMLGMDAVMHVAMPLVDEEPRDPSILIKPAVEGTRHVMEAANRAGIKRVVLTGSVAAVAYGHGNRAPEQSFDENDWTNPGGRGSWAYSDAKTLAEQFAWQYATDNEIGLSTILAGMILGPATDADTSLSLGIISRLLDGSAPAIPEMGFCVVDVRDVAAMHIAALESETAMGERYLATGPYVPFVEMADKLRERYRWANVTRKVVPVWLLRLLAPLEKSLKMMRSDIGIRKNFDGSKGAALMGRDYMDVSKTIFDTADALIELGIVGPGRQNGGR
ncbi:MAG: NAD-dependent epimerase/dehydratase family protein [Alphaproteobacteria bacterium]|nr:NAD-dependent epimerase/dehydratase family protein [Alphaproteobacteria bacterium]